MAGMAESLRKIKAHLEHIEGMTRSIKYFPCKHEDLSFDLQNLYKGHT